MLRRILLASVGAMALAGTAFAADLPLRAPPPVYVRTGLQLGPAFYVGGQLGYAGTASDLHYEFLHLILGHLHSTVSRDEPQSSVPSGAIGGAP